MSDRKSRAHNLIVKEVVSSLTKWRPLLCVFEVSVKSISIKCKTIGRFILKQLDYSLRVITDSDCALVAYHGKETSGSL